MSSAEDRLAPLIREISTGLHAGNLSFGGGEATIYFFFFNALHATAPAGRTGSDAVKYIGGMVARGATYEWTPAATGPTISLHGTLEDVCESLREGARDAERLPEPAQDGVPTSEPAAAPVPERADPPAVVEPAPAPTASQDLLAITTADMKADVPVHLEPLIPEGDTPHTDESTSRAESAVVEAPAAPLPPSPEDPLLDPPSDGQLSLTDAPQAPSPSRSARRQPSISLPPLLAGPSILEETPAAAARLDTFLGDAPRAQLVFRARDASGETAAVALLQSGHLLDALWSEPGAVVSGRAAYELILGAKDGSVSINELPEEVFAALPICWQGRLALPETPVADVDLDGLTESLSGTRATAAVQFSTSTNAALVLYYQGRMVAAYTASNPGRQMDRDAVAALADDPSARVSIRSADAAAPSADPTGISEPTGSRTVSTWDSFLSSATLVAQARLQSHSHRVEAILAAAAPDRQGAADAARQVRSLVQRGISPATMAALADQIEELAQQRL